MQHNLKLVFIALVAFMMVGCATVPMESKQADEKAKKFAISTNDTTSNIYIFRDSGMGAALKKNLFIDGEIIGTTAAHTFFLISAKTGTRTLSTQSEFSPNQLEVKVTPGKNLYVRQYIKLGVFVGGANLEQVDEKTAQKAIREDCSLAKPFTPNKTY